MTSSIPAEVSEELADLAHKLHLERTGHAPKAVTVVLSQDTLVITLIEALSPAEVALAQSQEGAQQLQQFHRELFVNSTEPLRRAIERLTGRDILQAAAEIETATGSVIHVFTTGSMVQVFLLAPLKGATGSNQPLPNEDSDGNPG